jgi:hypothetical protein
MANTVATYQDLVGLEIKPATTFGSVPGGSFRRVPLLGSTISPVQDTGPLDDETGTGPRGTLDAFDYARRFERGTVRTKAYYNLPVLFEMIAQAMGGCEVFGSGINWTAVPVTGGDYSGAHLFMPQSYHAIAAGSVGARPPGFAGRAWLSGEDDSGFLTDIDGMYINAMRFEQPQGEYPEFQFDFDCLKAVPADPAGESLASVPSGLYSAVWSDLSANPAQLDAGLVYVAGYQVPMYSFSMSLSRSSSFQPASATRPTTLNKPRHLDPWNLSGEIVVPLEAGITPAARPNWPAFNAADPDFSEGVSLRYSGPNIPSAVCGGAAVSYFWGISIRGAKFGTIERGLQRGTPVERIPFVAQAPASEVLFDGKTYRPLLTLTSQAVASGATGDSGSTFLAAASGGNDIPLGEIRLT